jgi:hypothetical protein
MTPRRRARDVSGVALTVHPRRSIAGPRRWLATRESNKRHPVQASSRECTLSHTSLLTRIVCRLLTVSVGS